MNEIFLMLSFGGKSVQSMSGGIFELRSLNYDLI